MSKQFILLAGVSSLTLLAGIARAAGAPDQASSSTASTTSPTSASTSEVSEVVVTTDKVGLLEKRPSETVFGLSKPLIETPRAATMISATNIQRYGITTIDQLTTVAPGTFTASFFGVAGSLQVRGTLAENYFEGFKLLTNFGTFTTPVGDASRIDIVRGPPSPIYGPGFVGGLLNFIPKSANDSGAYITKPSGEITYTGGSYDKNNVTAQIGGPIDAGVLNGGLYAYAEYDNSGSYYNGIHPKHFMGELSARFDLPDSWRLAADLMYYTSSGDVQTPGWNRLTQNLIDNQIYITGRNTTLSTNGAPYLSPDQATPSDPHYPFNYNSCGGAGLYCPYNGTYAGPARSPWMVLNTGVGTTKLSPQDIYVGPQDFSNTSTPTAYVGLSKSIPWADSTLKFEAFYNSLDNQRYVSYGFPAWLRGTTFEGRATYDFKLNGWDDNVVADTIVGASLRYDYSRDMESYDSGLIALDRRDLSVGPTPTDSLCNPFTIGDTSDEVPANCMGWETDIHTTWFDGGQFFTSDLTFFKKLDVTLGGRVDEYRVNSVDTGILDYDYSRPTPDHTPLSASKTEATYTASATYKVGWGLMPYATYAHTAAMQFDQISDIPTALIQNGGWIQYSTLKEVGLKFQELNGTLVGSLDWYDQDRPELNGLPPKVVNTVGSGVELEIRWVATRNFSFTFAGNMQHTIIKGPNTTLDYVPASAVCGNNMACYVDSFGGAYIVNQFSSLPGRSGDYEDMVIPHGVASLYGNYVSDAYDWGRVGLTAGLQHTSYTSGTIQDAVVFPAYYIANLSAFYQYKNYEIDLNVNNMFNQLYFIPDSGLYSNLGVLPGLGREVFVTAKARF